MSRRQRATRWVWDHGKLVAVTAVVVVAGGTVATTTCTCNVPVFGGGGGGSSTSRWPAVIDEVSTANVWVGPNVGNDSTCTFSSTPISYSAGVTCRSWYIADERAKNGGGGTVGVAPGTYAQDQVDQGGYMMGFEPNANTVNFKCQTGAAADSVIPSDGIHIFYGIQNVNFTGRCFHFHSFTSGLYGSPPTPRCNPTNGSLQTGPMTFNGVHFDNFDIVHSCNITIKNSQIGPFIGCWMPGSNAGVGECPATGPLASIVAWYRDSGNTGCTTVIQGEPYIHDDAFGTVLDNNLFTGLNTLDPGGVGTCSHGTGIHQGGLLVWTVTNTTIQNNEWRNVFLYCMEFNDTSTETNFTFQNNVCEHTVTSNYAEPNTATPSRISHAGGAGCQEGAGGFQFAGNPSKDINVVNGLWRYNTYSDCFQVVAVTGGQNVNVRIVGNLFGGVSGGGAVTCGTPSGVTYDHNWSGNNESCAGGGSQAGSPFTDVTNVPENLMPNSGTGAKNYVPCSSGDALLSTDILGVARPAATNCTAGAYETSTG